MHNVYINTFFITRLFYLYNDIDFEDYGFKPQGIQPKSQLCPFRWLLLIENIFEIFFILLIHFSLYLIMFMFIVFKLKKIK
jgi:hypothetical protein